MILREVKQRRASGAASGLRQVDGIPLGYDAQRFLDAALAHNGGPSEWRQRKAAEARDLLALGRLAPRRMQVEGLDLSGNLRALIRLQAPVPTRRAAAGELEIKPGALLGLTYRQEALLAPQPGASFVQILEPAEGVYLAQVPDEPPYLLCLAPALPAGIPCREIVLMSYAALTLQSFQFDAGHPFGVFNAEAANWWQANAQRIPLTDETFLDPAAKTEEGS